jgi:hypothetical protein
MGFFVPEPAKRGSPLPTMVGPVVRLGVCDAATWRAVVLVMCKHTDVEFVWHSPSTQEAIAPPELMMSADGWRFLRFKLVVPLADSAQQVHYRVKDRRSLGEFKDGCITVAGKADEWNLVAYSCYDQRRAIGEALWRDVAGAPMPLSFSICCLWRLACRPCGTPYTPGVGSHLRPRKVPGQGSGPGRVNAP